MLNPQKKECQQYKVLSFSTSIFEIISDSGIGHNTIYNLDKIQKFKNTVKELFEQSF